MFIRHWKYKKDSDKKESFLYFKESNTRNYKKIFLIVKLEKRGRGMQQNNINNLSRKEIKFQHSKISERVNLQSISNFIL